MPIACLLFISTMHSLIFQAATAGKPYVEFDLGPLPCEQNREWEFKFSVSTEKLCYQDSAAVMGATDRSTKCDVFAAELRKNGFEVEVIEKSKIRVYGAKTDDTFYPAIKGSVETKGLKKDEVPKVTVVGKKG